ncbi:MAG TPA: TolC family protein [Gemmataceae bacterium]|nr:TolC family protein [Gemmataceae bacterium]
MNTANPTVALARERVQEALALQREAEVLWLPNLQAGPAYLRHDGQIQNSRGDVFGVSKSNFFIGGGTYLRWDTSTLFAPLIARRVTQAASAQAQAVSDNVQLDVALTYLDLLQAHAQLAVNAETIRNAKILLDFADAAREAGKSKGPADLPRAQAEYEGRRAERLDLEVRAAAVSARLAQLLLLQPTVDLYPADPAVVPIVLVSSITPPDSLVDIALVNRPELARERALVTAAQARLRQARISPFLPRLELSYFAGDFGGGINENLSQFSGRGDGMAQAIWELHNLGAGDMARVRTQRTLVNQANLHVLEVQAQVAAEVTEAAKATRFRSQALANLQEAVRQAQESWRRLYEATRGTIGVRGGTYDPIEALIAEQTLAQVRSQYLTQLIEYNKAQFRLYTALGQPPLEAIPTAEKLPVQVPAIPPPAPKETKMPPALKPEVPKK